MKAALSAIASTLFLSGCLTYLFEDRRPVALDFAGLHREYVGSTMETRGGYAIHFEADGSYRTNRGQSGRYEILPSGVISMIGDRGTSLTTPDNIVVRRGESGMSFRVRKAADRYTHILDGTDRSGDFRRTDRF